MGGVIEPMGLVLGQSGRVSGTAAACVSGSLPYAALSNPAPTLQAMLPDPISPSRVVAGRPKVKWFNPPWERKYRRVVGYFDFSASRCTHSASLRTSLRMAPHTSTHSLQIQAVCIGFVISFATSAWLLLQNEHLRSSVLTLETP
jgi:hypothetical protein